MTYTIYLDESGQSGAGEDRAQPVFALAGVWIPPAQQTSLRAEVLDLKKRKRVQMDDLKGSDLIKRPRGQAFLTELFKLLESRQLPVTPVVIAKAFLGVQTAILVEDATDYVYNSGFDMSWTHPIPQKRTLADYLYDTISQDLLVQFLEHRRGSDPVEFARTADQIVRQAARAAMGEPFGNVVDQMIHTDFQSVFADAKGPYPVRHSPNQTALQVLLNEADRHAEDLGAYDCVIVHDEQSEYAEEIRFRSGLVMSTQTTDAERERLGQMRLPTRHLSELRFANSKAELGVQLADCAAAAVRTAVSNPERAPAVKTALADWLRACCGEYFPYAFGPTKWCVTSIQRLLTGVAS